MLLIHHTQILLFVIKNYFVVVEIIIFYRYAKCYDAYFTTEKGLSYGMLFLYVVDDLCCCFAVVSREASGHFAAGV